MPDRKTSDTKSPDSKAEGTASTTNKIVDAWPTKDFFISMLVRDIELIRAILDLADNAIDGARRLRADEHYKGLSIEIEEGPSHFKIADNCGGIPVDLARNYAFRFGRPSGMEETKHSVGQFGVGMKRALFKLGKSFRVESTTAASRFVVEVDVEEWKRDERNWQFEFKELEEKRMPEANRGTTITVTDLHESVREDFRLQNFENRLLEAISWAHGESIQRGMSISLNGTAIRVRPVSLLVSEHIKPACINETFGDGNRPPVTVRLYAGVAESEPADAGWYIFCNGRLVLWRDQAETSGWGEGGGRAVPKYHNQFARFRGYAFYDCDDATRLPWNTTKTGVDLDSGIYRATRQKMVTLMRPVIDFLNRLDKEKERYPTESGPLAQIVEASRPVVLSKLRPEPIFVWPRTPPEEKPKAKTAEIKYSRPIEKIRAVQKVLKVTSNRRVGEMTFDYFYDAECGE